MNNSWDGIVKVLVLVVGAIFFAVVAFFAIVLVLRRPGPSGGQPPVPGAVTVDGLVINLSTDPQKAIAMPTLAPETEATIQALFPPTATPPPTATAVPPTPEPEVIFVGYVVQSGDSLYSIAIAQNSSIELMAKYGIDALDLTPGALLNLPVANPAFCPGHRAYVVRDHDTVYSIALAFGTTPEAIRDLNNLDANYTIKTTQVICIP